MGRLFFNIPFQDGCRIFLINLCIFPLTMLIPPFLRPNAKIYIVSTAGVIDAQLVENAAKILESWGYRALVAPHALEQCGRFAGTLEERLADLQAGLDNPEYEAILFTRGGYGTIQLLDKMDLSAFLKRPKWLIGFSDITMIHSFLNTQKVCSIHGGMAKLLSESMHADIPAAKVLHNLLLGQWDSVEAKSHPLNRLGQCKGTLVGGNLSILYSLSGTPYDIKTKEKILFIEDIGEQPYVVDRMMHNLKLSGKLDGLAGLIVGQFTDYEEDERFGKTVLEIVQDSVKDFHFPVAFDFPIGHITNNIPLICGAEVQLTLTKEHTLLTYLKSTK